MVRKIERHRLIDKQRDTDRLNDTQTHKKDSQMDGNRDGVGKPDRKEEIKT